jgi:hypothetical protein
MLSRLRQCTKRFLARWQLYVWLRGITEFTSSPVSMLVNKLHNSIRLVINKDRGIVQYLSSMRSSLESMQLFDVLLALIPDLITQTTPDVDIFVYST